jgi:outer membrane lipoprotein-sorting protein
MGMLIGFGFTVHIMSSMIPVFLIPIAVLDSIHLLSEFHERYPKSRDRSKALREVMDELFVPMGFTTITTMVGFASLLLTPIPPVQVFGAFVSVGIGVAWLLSMTFLIAYTRLVPEKALTKFGFTEEHQFVGEKPMCRLCDFSMKWGRALVVAGAAVFVISVVGLTKIEVNDNPVNWFRADHPLRVADRTMNDHLSGTYLVYLELASEDADAFKDPETMRYVERLQRHLEEDPNVGATTSIADIIKKVRRELTGNPEDGIVPDSAEEIAQYLFLYEISGGDPEDLFKLITPESDRANLWIQMRRGENRDVAGVVQHASAVLAEAPEGLTATWAGLPYINVVWQQKMVAGMGKALAGSFAMVLIMMTFLFRSFRMALLSMVPLTATIVMVYGFIGWIGKPYDMPIAVLSSLSLGLSIDFAIHFLQRSREAYERAGDLPGALAEVFGAPARAILRNVFVIALGFVPMFFANLTPYVTVAVFFFAIMLISGFTTLFSLPATMATFGAGYLPRRGVPAMNTAKAAAAGLGILVLGLFASTAGAEAPDAEALMREAHLNMYYAAEDGRAVVEMDLVDKKGKSRVRKFVMLRLDMEDGGEQKYYTYFFEPNDVRRTTFLVWKDPVEDDSRWIYIPAVDLVKRISANDKGSSFVGSDFSYEDVSGRHWNDDTHEYVGQEETNGRMAHVIKSVPKEKDAFAEKKTWVGVDEKLPLREEYYDKKGNLTRVFLAEEIQEIDGWNTITIRSMENLKKKHKTTVTFSDVGYDVGVESDLFTERNLKNPPKDLRTL